MPTDEAACELAALRKERGSIKARLTTLTTFLNNLGDTELAQDKITIVERRVESIGPIIERFYEVQDRIDHLFNCRIA